MASSRAAEALLRLTAAALTAWLFASAAFSMPAHAGVSTFGRPPELAVAWLLAACGGAWWLLRTPDRASLARRLTLVLLAATVLGQRGVPGDGGARLLLMAFTLAVARPWLSAGRAALLTGAALLLAVPALVGSLFPQGGVLWLTYVLPPAALALLVPSLFAGAHVGRVVLVLLLATATLCALALASYVQLARGLELPTAAVLATRLRVLGLHPNLAVPHLVTTLLLAAGLAWTLPRRRAALVLLAALPVLAALLALRSRTGLLALGFGGALLAVQLLPARAWPPSAWRRALHLAAAVAVAALLLWPALGPGAREALQSDPSMVAKAVSFRASMWELGREAFAAAPWHGHGPGTSFVQALFARPGVYEGLPKDDHPHNVVLAVGGALGWPGLLGLALLFAGGLLGLRRNGVPAHAAGAALLALWAANAIDLGGADATLYPALVFLLLGLREAAERDPAPPGTAQADHAATEHAQIARARAQHARADDAQAARVKQPPHAATAVATGPAARRTAAVVPWLAGACALLGASLAAGEACERRAAAEITAAEARARAPSPSASAPELPEPAGAAPAEPPGDPQRRSGVADATEGAGPAPRTQAWLRWAGRLQPFDPNVPLLRARLASLSRRPADTLAALLEARALFPGSASLAHQSALVLAALAPDDPRVEAWLAEAVRLDPFGPESWRRHLDRARVAARRFRAEESRAALLAAVLLNPAAAADLPRRDDGAELVLYPAGVTGGAAIRVAELRADLALRRESAQAVDPDEASRLRLREVELLAALGRLAEADALAHELLAGSTLYLQTRTAGLRLAEGRFEEAAERLRGILHLGVFSTRGDLAEALSRSAVLDAAAFDAHLADTWERMARDVDVVFELDTVRKLLRARQRCAERAGDLRLAVRLSDASDFARR